MKNKSFKWIVTSISFIVVISTLSLYFHNKIIDYNNKLTSAEISIGYLKQRLFLSINSQSFNVSNATISDHNTKKVNPMEITKDCSLGLYVDKYQCDKCWRDELLLIKNTIEDKEILNNVFLLAGNFSPREIKLLAKELEFPIFSIEVNSNDNIKYLAKFNLPYYFVLKNNGDITSVYFPDSRLYDEIGKTYFKMVSKICTDIEDISATFRGLLVENPVVDLGNVKGRRKYDFEFKIKNLENRTCHINKIDVSCACVVLNKDNPLFIYPNSEVIIRATIIPTGKGVFSKTIWLDTDFQRKPYELVVTGTL